MAVFSSAAWAASMERRANAAASGGLLRVGVGMLEPLLPTKRQVLQACQGLGCVRHPLLDALRQLTEPHAEWAAQDRRFRESERRRVELIDFIDDWVHSALPPAHGCVALHAESLGSIADRLAHLAACAAAHLAPTLVDVWGRLAELAVGYRGVMSRTW
ncbi:DUF4254 domain-containing protein [Nocardia sp. NPDC004860]|uniref:DUF4254 domain-containing protein n=1 Tax=Nocardia sp. NPDC004860 TaxID=3154557 RepID=UPI0033A43EBF